MQTIVTAEYGSRAIGVATADSDHDLMSVFIEDPEYVLGIETIDTHASSTAAAGARSTHEDTDTTRYPLRKWARLAAVGNPTVLLLLFLEPLKSTKHWEVLRGIRDAFVSREAHLGTSDRHAGKRSDVPGGLCFCSEVVARLGCIRPPAHLAGARRMARSMQRVPGRIADLHHRSGLRGVVRRSLAARAFGVDPAHPLRAHTYVRDDCYS
ncbi:nucleotidyltransferase domain-containing protein [Herbiconiux sp. KACC 21604]|uniref:DNA polymerase beta superfamily protein n=1 Tax=unclassified Herbiconiux TaxID=2618217 RepID=UPI00149182E9|nr:nucleotidyltransferase domain-containing protein [Herbiconiux sp. SALV-R1]QJU52697.1 hypothetical protein HL652_02930 [Herbiconiux sp. SALV-R1]WPO87596.1 nucleotidyltransferase domain-containing protein [Herbiconiux sp. KACC 21604]